MKTFLQLNALLISFIAFGQIGIEADNPHPSSMIELNSTDKGLLLPRLTTIQRDNIVSPALGLTIYNTDINCMEIYNNGAWMSVCPDEVIIDPPEDGTIQTLDCSGARHRGELYINVPASIVETEMNYTNGNGGTYDGLVINSTGVTGLTAVLEAGNFANGNATLIFKITGTPSSTGNAIFSFTFEGINCSFSRNVAAQGTITLNNVLNYNGVSPVNSQGIGFNGENIPAASTILIRVTTTGGTPYNFVATDNVSGLVYQSSGFFPTRGVYYNVILTNNGVAIPETKYGTINMTLSGIINTTNTLALSPRIDIKSIPSDQTEINTVEFMGLRWMDRNLGARRAGTSINDPLAFGNYYQGNRTSDGHEIVVLNGDNPTTGAGMTGITNSHVTPANPHNMFVWRQSASYHWSNPENVTSWNTTTNNPCPAGFRLPTFHETMNFMTGGTSNPPYTLERMFSEIKLVAAGVRGHAVGSFENIGSNATLVSGDNSGLYISRIYFYPGTNTGRNGAYVTYGTVLRCVQPIN